MVFRIIGKSSFDTLPDLANPSPGSWVHFAVICHHQMGFVPRGLIAGLCTVLLSLVPPAAIPHSGLGSLVSQLRASQARDHHILLGHGFGRMISPSVASSAESLSAGNPFHLGSSLGPQSPGAKGPECLMFLPCA